MIVLLHPQGFRDIPREKIAQVTQAVSRLDCSVNISDPQNFGIFFLSEDKIVPNFLQVMNANFLARS